MFHVRKRFSPRFLAALLCCSFLVSLAVWPARTAKADVPLEWQLVEVRKDGEDHLEIPYSEKTEDDLTVGLGIDSLHSDQSFTTSARYTESYDGEQTVSEKYDSTITWDVPIAIQLGKEEDIQITVHSDISDTWGSDDFRWITSDIYVSMDTYSLTESADSGLETGSADDGTADPTSSLGDGSTATGILSLESYCTSNTTVLHGRNVGYSYYQGRTWEELNEYEQRDVEDAELRISVRGRLDVDPVNVEGFVVAPFFTETFVYRVSTPNNPIEPQNGVINTEAPEEIGIFGETVDADGKPKGWTIPLPVVVGGAAAVVAIGAGAVALTKGRNAKKSDNPQDKQQREEKREEQPSTFSMVLWKNFSNMLVVGDAAQQLGARIEELKPDGTVVRRDDLTCKITFSISENLRAEALGMQGPYQMLRVCAPGPHAGNREEGLVSIKFTGVGGVFVNNVHFKVSELKLEFPDVPLTFVAGDRKTYVMPFKIVPEGYVKPTDEKVRFEVCYVDPKTEESFLRPRVMPDDDYPNELFAVEIKECGTVTEDDVPGTMENHGCTVVATLPPGAFGDNEIKVEGNFRFFRFFEGLRLTVEPLKCYVEKYTEKEDLLINADDALTAASTLTAEAMGMAGAVNPAVLRPSVEQMLRESARTSQEMFPELFREDDVYVLDRRDEVKVTPARTHAYLTLYVVKEYTNEKGNAYTRPSTVLPKKDEMFLIFEDVPGSSVLYDKEGKEVAHPADVCDFKYFISDLKTEDNTVVFEILPTRAILIPPNRAKVKVTASALWEDRVFKAEQTVNAISQPYRKDFIDNWETYTLGDEDKKGDYEIARMLKGIQARIQGRYNGKVAVKGVVSATEVAKDVLYDTVEFVDDLYMMSNPMTAPGIALWSLYQKIRGEKTFFEKMSEHQEAADTSVERSIARQSQDIYYDDLMPLYHYIQTMLDGYDEHFGFFEPDLQRVVITLARFERGELGSAEAIDLAYFGHDLEYADCMKMVIQDFASSWTMVGLRIGFAVLTAGDSEIFFIPFQALSEGIVESLNYIDRGGDSLLEAYRVGMDRAGKAALLDVAIEGAFTVVSKAVKGAWILTKEAFAQRQAFLKATQEMFSSFKFGTQIKNAATNVAKQVADADAWASRLARDMMTASRGGLDVALKDMNREIAYTLGRIKGSYKVDAAMRLMDDVTTLSKAEQRAVIVAIQSDKHAMRILMERTSVEAMEKSHTAVKLKDFFNHNIWQIEDEVIDNTIKQLKRSKAYADKQIQAFRTSGNSANKVGMDLDVTFRYLDENGAWKDINSATAQKAFNSEFYKLVKGTLADETTMARFTRMADMTVTDLFHPEAYSEDFQDVVRILNEARAGEAFTYAGQVRRAAEYKCMHWFSWAREAAKKAAELQELQKLGSITEEQVKEMYRYASLSEALVEEGMRQYTKQADRIIIKKLAAMAAEKIAVNSTVNMKAFFRKVALLKKCGAGLSPDEVEKSLMREFGCTLEDVFHELGVYIEDVSNSIKAVKGV